MKAFIFDFDGVIVDSEKHWDADSLKTYQTIIPSFTEEHNKLLKGRNVHDIYEWLREEFSFSLAKDEYLSIIHTYASELYKHKIDIIPGIPELLHALEKRGIPIAIASSSERQWIEPPLKNFQLEAHFPIIVTAVDVGVGKPNPAVFLRAAELLKADPKDCVVLEDSTNGVRAAKAAGMTCYALKHEWGYEQDLSEADFVVESVEEIVKKIGT